MPKSGTYGAVRGVPGNRYPYRDRQQHLPTFHLAGLAALTPELQLAIRSRRPAQRGVGTMAQSVAGANKRDLREG